MSALNHQIITQHGRDQTMSSPQRSVTRRSSMIANKVHGWPLLLFQTSIELAAAAINNNLALSQHQTG